MVCVCVTKLCVKDGVCVCVCVCVCESCVWKRACDKNVCERWCVTKWCVKDGVAKDGVWQSCVGKMVCWKMVCDKVVCERWCVTKWCVKDGVWKMVCDGVWKMVCDKVVCERWCPERWWVTKMVCDNVVCERWCVDKVVCERWCVKDGVSKIVCDRVVCERWCVTKWCVKWCVTKWCVKEGVLKMVGPSAPPEPAQCHKCHACHAKRRWMSPSAALATRNEGGCHQVPHVPHEMKVHVTKCHACHAKWRGVTGDQRRPCQKCHACHAKRRCMWPSATPAMQSRRWWLTKICVKDGVCKRWSVKDGVWKMVCDKVVRERWCVTKLCVKDGGWQRWCVKDGLWQSCVWKRGGGGGGGRGGGGGGGIQNQKQDTKMWGMKNKFGWSAGYCRLFTYSFLLFPIFRYIVVHFSSWYIIFLNFQQVSFFQRFLLFFPLHWILPVISPGLWLLCWSPAWRLWQICGLVAHAWFMRDYWIPPSTIVDISGRLSGGSRYVRAGESKYFRMFPCCWYSHQQF